MAEDRVDLQGGFDRQRQGASPGLGQRILDWLDTALNTLFPPGAGEPELVPVPVRPNPPRPRDDRAGSGRVRRG